MPPTQVMACTIELGDAIPTTVGNVPGLVNGTANLANTPPATGVLTSAQAPSGAVVTNTGRTIEAHQSYMATSLNILNVGKTPPPTGNLPH